MEDLRTGPLSRVDGYAIRLGDLTVIEVAQLLCPSLRAAVTRYLRRAMVATRDHPAARVWVARGEAAALPPASPVVVRTSVAPDVAPAQRTGREEPARAMPRGDDFIEFYFDPSLVSPAD